MAVLSADLLKAESKQYSHDNRGPEFGKLVMEVFAMINTNVRQNRQFRDEAAFQ
jgi:hypothetical protein